jgi:hypothetical protein
MDVARRLDFNNTSDEYLGSTLGKDSKERTLPIGIDDIVALKLPYLTYGLCGAKMSFEKMYIIF